MTPDLRGIRYHEDVLGAVGGTPLVRLRSIARDCPAPVLAKIESLNPGGSVKDRIGLAMVEAAERSGALPPGGTIVECTSGNTGAGLAMVAAVRGYRCVFVMPDKVSNEKVRLLEAYGAKVVLAPADAPPDSPESYYSVARRITAQTPGAALMDQYHNESNPESHYRGTGPEIWEQTGGRVTHFVAGMGTGGTISGVARFLKERNPAVQAIGADPVGSILGPYKRTGEMVPARPYKVEGVGEDFLPGTLDLGLVDRVVSCTDRDAIRTTLRLAREEGILAGGSAGLAAWVAVETARDLAPSDLVVVLLPDTGDRYLSKIFDPAWRAANGFEEGR